MKCASRWITSLGLVLALSACTTLTSGTGGGRVTGEGAAPAQVSFSWTSSDGGISGVMTAALPGQTFSGRFFQITEQTRAEVLTPLWSRWPPGWHDWPPLGRPWMVPQPYPYPYPYPYAYPTTQFLTHFTGKVVASLESPEGPQQIRCRFDLVEPVRGMGGGGDGDCQFSDGRTVRAVFSASTR